MIKQLVSNISIFDKPLHFKAWSSVSHDETLMTAHVHSAKMAVNIILWWNSYFNIASTRPDMTELKAYNGKSVSMYVFNMLYISYRLTLRSYTSLMS